MTISELIKKLEELKQFSGEDAPIILCDNEKRFLTLAPDNFSVYQDCVIIYPAEEYDNATDAAYLSQ